MTSQGKDVRELLDVEGDLARPVTMSGMRGTNFIAGRRWLRERGLEARYLDAMRPKTSSAAELNSAALRGVRAIRNVRVRFIGIRDALGREIRLHHRHLVGREQ